QPAAIHLHLVAAREARLAEIHLDAELVAVAGGRVVLADARADGAHAAHRGSEVGLRAGREREADLLLGTARLGREARRANHTLRRPAADGQTVAAEVVALDHRDLRAEPRADRGRDQARRPGADHHEVVATRGLRVLPRARVHVLEQRAIRLVLRLDRG